MKFKISPSYEQEHCIAAEIDTLTNDDMTSEAVSAALHCVIAAGHSPMNVVESARQWSEDLSEVIQRKDDENRR